MVNQKVVIQRLRATNVELHIAYKISDLNTYNVYNGCHNNVDYNRHSHTSKHGQKTDTGLAVEGEAAHEVNSRRIYCTSYNAAHHNPNILEPGNTRKQ